MLSKLLTTGTNRLFDLPGTSHHKGLSGLAHKLLGKPLDKRDQISDWTRRPLTKEQVQLSFNSHERNKTFFTYKVNVR